MNRVRRGDVVEVCLDPTIGSEIRKTRPCIVVSNDLACLHDSVVQIVPITGLKQRPLYPFEARVGSSNSGLTKPSRAVTNQIRTVALERLEKKLGRLTTDELAAVEAAMALQLGLALPE